MVLAAVGVLLAAASAGARAEPCRTVAAGSDLPDEIASAAPGTRLCLAAGDHQGPIQIPPGVTLSGPREARIVAGRDGTTVRLAEDGAALEGVTVDGSGARFDLLDAAVLVTGDDTRVENVRIVSALFGIRAEQANRVVLRGNEVVGRPEQVLGLRGDGIRLWEVRDSTVAENRLTDSRDLVVWYSPGNRFMGNRVERGRYGTHFMYSHDNHVEGNVYASNVVGIFVMYSRRLVLEGNRLEHAAGAAGIGVGLKESGDVTLRENQLLGNTVGLYIDTSPLDQTEHNHFERNRIRFHDRAIVFHGTVDRNRFAGNSLEENRIQVALEGRGDARAADWRGNHWDDYSGYDLDRDGTGDVAYELRSLANEWIARIPALAFFRGSVAMAAVEWLGKALPLFQPTTLLVDPAPRMKSPTDLAVAD
jgi:nitrous oxidase accessory protein